MKKQLTNAGVRATVYQDGQWRALSAHICRAYQGVRHREPLILIGHSFGADDVLAISHDLQAHGITIDLLVTIDAVYASEVPPNVRKCVNIYQSNGPWDMLPFFRGLPLVAAREDCLQNFNLRKNRTDLLEPDTNHFNIEKDPKVQALVLREVLKICTPRGPKHRERGTSDKNGGGTKDRSPPSRPNADRIHRNIGEAAHA